MKELKETVNLMESEDYKERFIAEYAQVKIRTLRLLKTVKKHFILITGEKSEVNCPIGLLINQLEAMGSYLDILRDRAVVEGIELPEIEIDE